MHNYNYSGKDHPSAMTVELLSIYHFLDRVCLKIYCIVTASYPRGHSILN
jgi:hypothetical protein